MFAKLKSSVMKRLVYGVAITLLSFSMLVPVFNGKSFAAGQVTSRSIEMSSSTSGATNTTYLISFTTATTATLKSLVVDFCDNDPIIGDSTCTAPTGFSVGTPTAVQSGLPGTWTATSANTNRTLILTNATNSTSVTSSTAVTITLSTATNPTTDNHSFYARILTYVNSSGADSAATYAPGSEGNYIDGGGVAMSTGKNITITARVMETLSFCVYNASCGDSPNMTIGHGANNILDATAVDTKTALFSLSTNANSGATIRMKGDTLKAGSNTIPAAGASAITFAAGTADFGMRVSTPGTGITATSPYNGGSGTQYAFNTTNTLGTYGDNIATLSGPVNTSVTTLTFAATAANTTAAGIYTATEQLIATGQF